MFAVLFSARKAIRQIVFLFTAFWVAACQPVSLSGPNNGGFGGNGAKPVPVALLVPHGADNAQEQQIARDLEAAARLAVADLEGVQIDLRVYGTAGNAAQAQTAALTAVADGARIILGPLHAETANAAAVAVANKGINVLAFSNNPTIAGGNLFILGQTFNSTANRLADFAARQGKERILAVYSDNLAGRLGSDAIQSAVNASSAQFAGSVSYEFSQEGVASAVPEIREAATVANADAIFMTSNTAGALPLLTQMLLEAGLNPQETQYIGLSRWDVPAQTTALPGVQGGWFAVPDPRRDTAFKSRFQEATGNAAHGISGLAYDGIAAIGALAKSGDRDAFSRTQLTQPAGFQGVSGVFRFMPDGTNERGLAVATIRDQKVVVIDPAPQRFVQTGF